MNKLMLGGALAALLLFGIAFAFGGIPRGDLGELPSLGKTGGLIGEGLHFWGPMGSSPHGIMGNESVRAGMRMGHGRQACEGDDCPSMPSMMEGFARSDGSTPFPGMGPMHQGSMFQGEAHGLSDKCKEAMESEDASPIIENMRSAMEEWDFDSMQELRGELAALMPDGCAVFQMRMGQHWEEGEGCPFGREASWLPQLFLPHKEP